MSKTRYLQQLGQSWYVRIKVPATLYDRVGSTHIRRALHTRDLDEANRRKWSAIVQVRAYFDSLHSGATAPLSFHVQSETLGTKVPVLLQPQPTAYLDLRPATGLDALAEEWAITSTVKTVQFQRRQAYKELRDYLQCDHSPTSFSGTLAATYVDERLLKSPDSQSTRRRKLSALAAFWEWMASRRYTPKGMNPWKGFRLKNDESKRTKPKKRPYTSKELVTLFSGDPTYPALREVMVLGLYTGARIDEICSLSRSSVRFERGIAYVQIIKSKTNSGARTLAVAHPIPLGLLKTRHGRKATATAQLFDELRGVLPRFCGHFH